MKKFQLSGKGIHNKDLSINIYIDGEKCRKKYALSQTEVVMHSFYFVIENCNSIWPSPMTVMTNVSHSKFQEGSLFCGCNGMN